MLEEQKLKTFLIILAYAGAITAFLGVLFTALWKDAQEVTVDGRKRLTPLGYAARTIAVAGGIVALTSFLLHTYTDKLQAAEDARWKANIDKATDRIARNTHDELQNSGRTFAAMVAGFQEQQAQALANQNETIRSANRVLTPFSKISYSVIIRAPCNRRPRSLYCEDERKMVTPAIEPHGDLVLKDSDPRMEIFNCMFHSKDAAAKYIRSPTEDRCDIKTFLGDYRGPGGPNQPQFGYEYYHDYVEISVTAEPSDSDLINKTGISSMLDLPGSRLLLLSYDDAGTGSNPMDHANVQWAAISNTFRQTAVTKDCRPITLAKAMPGPPPQPTLQLHGSVCDFPQNYRF